MSGFLQTAKHLFLPALIAFGLWAFLAYVALPLYRAHRNRYAQYLPLDTISSHTNSLWERVTSGFAGFITRQSGLFAHRIVVDGRHFTTPATRRDSAGSVDESVFGHEEGESMVGFDMGRRERGQEDWNDPAGNERRLSRDLEEGFRDQSESEDEARDDRR